MKADTATQSDKLTLRPYARLLTMLGDQLITSERVALIEILKNSYDADASWVKVTFEGFDENFKIISPDAKIVIEDDGTGMDDQLLRKHWVNPATPQKKNKKKAKLTTTEKGREIQGEKGIGRFALLKLGRTIVMTTRTDGGEENVLTLDVSKFSEDFTDLEDDSRDMFLDELDITLQKHRVPTIVEDTMTLGGNSFEREPHGTKIEITNLNGKWNQEKVREVYNDLIRLQTIFAHPDGDIDPRPNDEHDFNVFVYRGDDYQPFSDQHVERLHALIQDNSVLRIEDGYYNNESGLFTFKLNGVPRELKLNDPDLSGIRIFRDRFGKSGEHLESRGKTACGSFGFGFYVFDFRPNIKGPHFLDEPDKKLIKEHRIYLYRDGIRVYPYGDPKDDWLEIDIYRGTISAGQFLSNDQVVGFVNITQRDNPDLTDKTSREGLIDKGDATEDFRTLLKLFLAWVRKKPFEQYKLDVESKSSLETFKQGLVEQTMTSLHESLSGNASAQKAVATIAKLYNDERSYLVKRAEATEHLAGVGLSVETASHDVMAILGRTLLALDSLIKETQRPGALDKDVFYRDLTSIRGMMSFIETQMQDVQSLFKSTKQRRKTIRVKEVVDRVVRLFMRTLDKEHISFDVVEQGASPLVAKTTDAVLLQLLLNLFDNAVYWLQAAAIKNKKIRITLDSDENVLIFSDNGPGIKPDDATYIFEPFYSGRGEEGRGLGLYIAKQLLERHEYDIDLAEFKEHKVLPGANFVVSFVIGG